MKIKKLVIFLAIFVLCGSVVDHAASAAFTSNTCSGTCKDVCDFSVENISSVTGESCATGYCCVTAGSLTGSTSSGASEAPTGSTSSSASEAPTGSSTSDATGTGVHIPTAEETGLSGAGIQDILVNLLKWLLSIVGIIALIGFAISGVQYMIASGDDDMIKTAKSNMTNSIIGIVVVLASFVIIQAIDLALRGSSSSF